VQSRLGRIHVAQGGTLFLDEIGELPLSMQAKLLRFLQNGEVQRLGSSDVYRVDVRVVCATNVRLPELVKARQFREDLYYRLAIFRSRCLRCANVPRISTRCPVILREAFVGSNLPEKHLSSRAWVIWRSRVGRETCVSCSMPSNELLFCLETRANLAWSIFGTWT